MKSGHLPKHIFYSVFALSLVLVYCVTAAAVETRHRGQGDLSERLQKRYENTNDIKAKFIQDIYPAGSSEVFHAEGVVYFRRPELMRWEYSSPEPQLIVTSGNEVYIYEEEAQQVTVVPREKLFSSDVSKAFFFGKGKLADYFEVISPGEQQQDGNLTLKLIPRKPVPHIEVLWITLDPETDLIREMRFQDQLGSKTRLKFVDMVVNSGLSRDLFSFVPPEGVSIFRTEQ